MNRRRTDAARAGLAALILTTGGIALASPVSAAPGSAAGHSSAAVASSSSGTTAHAADAARRAGYTVQFGTRTVTVKAVAAKVVTAKVSGPNRVVAQRIKALIDAEAKAGLTRFSENYDPSVPNKGSYELTARVVANRAPVLSIEFSEYIYLGGAHPVLDYHAVVADTRAGHRWSNTAIATGLRRAIRPGHSLDAELRTAVRRVIPEATAADVAPLTSDTVTLIPTRSGLTVDVDHCELTCAFGPIQAKIAWGDLLAPDRRVVFVPWWTSRSA